jgi:DNA polymerase-1
VLAHLFGVRITAPMFDTMLAAQILDGGKSDNRQFNLKAVARDFGLSVSKEEREWFSGLDSRSEWSAPFPDEQVEYMCQDVAILEPIYLQQTKLLREKGLEATADLEMKVIVPIAMMELHGIAVDTTGWEEFIEEKRKEASQLEDQVTEVLGKAILQKRIQEYDAAVEAKERWEAERTAFEAALRKRWEEERTCGWGEYKVLHMRAWRDAHPNPGKPKLAETINLGSWQQVMDAFEHLGIPAKTTREEDLKLLADDHPVIRLYLNWKKKRKLTEFDLPACINPISGRVHTHFRQIIDTGRMASSKPNMQQIPSRGEDGKKMRKHVVAEPGNVLVINDYPGIEDRIMCYYSGDPVKRRVFNEGLDPHTETARLLFDLPPGINVRQSVAALGGKSYRDVAKELNYGLAYGLSPARLAKKLNILLETARDLYDKYVRLHKTTFEFLEAARESAKKNMYSRTRLGRVRYYEPPEKPDVRNLPASEVGQAFRDYRRAMERIGRQGANHIIQGSAADIMKQALVTLVERLPEEARLVLAVHDEVVVECPEDIAEYVRAVVEMSMQEAAEDYLEGFPVPCDDANISSYWTKE